MAAHTGVPERSVRLALRPGAFADQRHRTAFATAALGVCLSRYVGRSRLVIGAAPADGVVRPVVLDFGPTRSFRELLDTVLTQLDGAAPGHAVTVDALCRTADLSSGLATTAGVELLLDAAHPAATVLLTGDRFDATEASWFRDHLVHVLDMAAGDAAAAVRELGALPPSLQQLVLTEWNGGLRRPAGEYCLHRLVEDQVRARPDAPALHEGDRTISYTELNARANRLARLLIDTYGVRPGDHVAIALPRSIEQVVVILAVLKTGAAYVPLDPAHPADRLAFILGDTASTVVLTDIASSAALPATTAVVIAVDRLGPELAGLPADDLTVPDLTRGAACIVYTSGTTGRPKGVPLTHRGLANSVRWEHRAYRFRPGDRMLHLASSTFSLAIVELFGPLCAGAQVVIAPAGASRDGSWITKLVVDHGVTLLSVVPSELKLLLDNETGLPWTALRCVITGADVLPVPVQNQLLSICPSVALFNIYGQTESSVDGTYWICEQRTGQTAVPVGRPVTNTTMYVLDEHLQPVPVGVPGELYTGGPALAHGYLGLPRLTAERFVPNPFARSAEDNRLYRSGDIARWLPGGMLALLGRHDRQIQLRGIRIELEEIEAVLREHPSVLDAVVAPQTTGVPVAVPAGRAEWAAVLAELDGTGVLRALDEIETSAG